MTTTTDDEPRVVSDPTTLPAEILALGADSDPAALDGFLAGHAFPLIEPGRATFVWSGEAERVELLRWIHAGVDRMPLQRLHGTPLWVVPVAVQDNGRFEYKLSVMREGHEDWVLDPLNPVTAEDPFGSNSVCRTHGYARPEWSEPQGAPRGRLETLRIDSEAFGAVREERVYLPAALDAGQGADATAWPLLVVHDGEDFVEYGALATSLDNLIHRGDVPPLIAVLVQSGDRMSEYPRGRRHARYVVTEVLPALEERYSLSADPARRVLMGASLGAVASLSTAFRYPGTFGGLVLASGSFILDPARLQGRPHPVFRRVASLVRALRRAPPLQATRAYVSTGELEGLADENRALADFLADQGVRVRFDSAWDGHHWHAWRDRLRDALVWVFDSEPADPADEPQRGETP